MLFPWEKVMKLWYGLVGGVVRPLDTFITKDLVIIMF